MRQKRSVTEVTRHFKEYINRVAYRGERFVLTRGREPVAELGPVPGGGKLGELPELLASLPRLPEAEAADFAEELSAARSRLSESPLSERWPS